MSKTENRINKARYWTAVLYPENMVKDWELLIGDIVQYPYAYCVHNADIDSKSEHRKDHVHIILVFPNTTTYKHAKSVFDLLSKKDKHALNTCEAVVGIRNCYDYLIHDTETCRKQGKHQYEPSERITGNNFDIGSYEQLSSAEKNAMFEELSRCIEDFNFSNYADFFIFALNEYVSADANYLEILKTNSGHFDRMTRAIFLRNSRNTKNGYFSQKDHDFVGLEKNSPGERPRKAHEKTTQAHAICCPDCGSVDVIKKGKTAGGTPRFMCKDCGKKFVK